MKFMLAVGGAYSWHSCHIVNREESEMEQKVMSVGNTCTFFRWDIVFELSLLLAVMSTALGLSYNYCTCTVATL